MTSLQKILIILAFLVGLLLRLYHLRSPIIDWHSHRQSDTASVTAIYLDRGIDLLFPRYFDLSDVQSGRFNPRGLRFVEFPLVSALVALISTPQNFQIIHRLINIFFSLGTAALIFLISKTLTGQFLASFFSMSVFLFLPFSVFYSRVILPEPAAVFFMCLSLYYFPRRLLLSSLALALSLLLKPFTGIILFPVLLILAYSLPKSFNLVVRLLLFALISLFPFLLWRLWISNFPQGIPASSWLFNQSDSPVFPEWFHGISLSWLNSLVAFRPHWFYWLFYVRPVLIFSLFGYVPLVISFLYRFSRHLAVKISLFSGIILYFAIVAGGNLQHDYYQVLILPFLSILLGWGLYYIYYFSPLASYLLFLIIVWQTFTPIHNYYSLDHPEYVDAGEFIRQNTPPNSLILSPNSGDTTFLYQTRRQGYPVRIDNFAPVFLAHPRQPIFLVLFDRDDYAADLTKIYPIFYKTDKFAILKVQ